MEDVSHDPRVGSVLQERYRILERLAVGSMGIVYRAERLLLGRPLAVKFLHASYAADPTFIQRFERETRVMGRLAHPHCVSVIDFGVDSGPYVVMEFVSGRTLRSLLEGGRLSVERAVHIVRQTLAGLAHAHSLGIVHRDIKPANIMLMEATGTGDHVRILDFGLATLREAPSDISHSAIVIGTPNYMSPEQSVGSKADTRSDVYSTGVVLFELLTGRKPFTSDDTFELLSMHRLAPVPRLANMVPDADFPPGLQEVLDKALAKQPEDRFQTAMEFALALDRALDAPSLPAPARAARHATRPMPGGQDDRLEHRRQAAVPRGQAMRAARPRRRRRRRTRWLLVAGGALLAAAGTAWGGYRLWRGEIGERLRAVIERPPPKAPPPEAKNPVPADTGPDQVATSKPTGAVGSGASLVADASSKTVVPDREQPKPALPGDGASDGTGGPRGMSPPAGTEADIRAETADRVENAAGAAPAAVPVGGEVAKPGAGGAAGAGDAGGAPGGGGAAAGAEDENAEDEIPAEPALPPEEREEPVAPVSDYTAMVDKIVPASESAAKAPSPATASPVAVDSVADAVALIRGGKREEAIQALVGLRRKMPKSAYVPYLLGHLYFEKGWWNLGMDYYEAAIRNNELYRGKRILNQNVIRALGSKSARKKATRVVVNDIGLAAVPFLKRAARTDHDPAVRDWCEWLLWRLNQLMRRGAVH